MSEFKVGDRVRWTILVGTITDGPFLKTETPDGGRYGSPTYVVQFHDRPAKLIAEGNLVHESEWEPCPGEHRMVRQGEYVPALHTWERRRDR